MTIAPESISLDLAAAVVDGLNPADPRYVRRRQGVVAAVNGGFPVTVNVTLGGLTIPGVRVLSGYAPVTGDTVMVDFNGPDPMVLGSTAGTGAGAGGPVTLGITRMAADVGVTSTEVTLATITVTVPSGRTLRLSASGQINNDATTGIAVTRFKEGATELGRASADSMGASATEVYSGAVIVAPSAGTHTYTLTGQKTGAGQSVYIADPSVHQYLLVEDITGNPAPYNPASVPVGLLGYGLHTAPQAGIVTETDIIGLSVNVTVPAGRVLRITARGQGLTSNLNEDFRVNLYDNATWIQLEDFRNNEPSGTGTQFNVWTVVSPSAGAHTFKATVLRIGGTGSINIDGNASYPAILTVEDITPTPAVASGAPSSTLGYAEALATQSGITTTTDLTGLSVTVTVPAGRRLKITAEVAITSTVTTDGVDVQICEGATVLQDRTAGLTGNAEVDLNFHAVVSPSAGTHTYKLRASRFAGSGVASITAAANKPASILVEDITGALWTGTTWSVGAVASEPWMTYPVVLLADTVNPTLGAGSSTMGRYTRIGRTIIGKANITFGSSGTAPGTGFFSVSAPVVPAINPDGFTAVVGSGYVYNGTLYPVVIFQDNGAQLFRLGIQAGTLVGNVTPFAWGANNQIRLNFTYEAAS